jgi:hypothetical protein
MARRWLAVAALSLVLVLNAGGARALQASSEQRVTELGLTVTAGFDGHASETTWQPVTVGLEPARPVAGTLSLQSIAADASENIAVEVAAGSRKLYRFLAPPGPLTLTFTEEGTTPLSVRPPNQASTNEYVVGLLGGEAGNLPPLRSDLTGQVGVWASVDPAWLALSPRALEMLGAVVARPEDLQALEPQSKTNLAAAVAAGTDLILAGAQPADLGALELPWDVPDGAWQADVARGALVPSAGGAPDATAIPAGYGRVVVTPLEPGAAGAGRSSEVWSALAQPSSRDSQSSGDYRVTAEPHQFSRLLAEEGSDAPTLPGLGLFVVAYVLVVGPVNGVVLARLGRRELAWATVPMVTVIFTIGAFLGATSARPSHGGAARLTYWTDGVGTEFIAAGVRAPTPGERHVTLPGTGWTVRPLVDGQRGATTARDTDTRVTMTLTSLQLGGVAAWRTVADPPPLTVEASANATGVTVKVRNTSGRPLDDVVVRTATASRALAELAPGETGEVTMGGAALTPSDVYRDPFGELPLDINGQATPPLAMRAALNSEVADGRPGMVWVSGIDRSQPPIDVRTGDEAARNRGTMVAVGEQVAATRRLSPYAIARDAFVLGGATRIGPQGVEGNGQVFLRFRLPPGADPAQISDQLERSNQSDGRPNLTVWNDVQRRWVDADVALGGPDWQSVVSPLGEVWARVDGEMFPFEFAGRSIAGGSQ